MALTEISNRKPVIKNRLAPETEQEMVGMAIEQPAYGQAGVSNQLAKRGLSVSPADVQCAWQQRPGNDQKVPESAGGQDGAGRPGANRVPRRGAVSKSWARRAWGEGEAHRTPLPTALPRRHRA
jgi:hypothetical protein